MLRLFQRIACLAGCLSLFMLIDNRSSQAENTSHAALDTPSVEFVPDHDWRQCHFAMSNWFYGYQWDDPEAQVQILADQGYEGIVLSLKDEPKRWAMLPKYLEALKKHQIKLVGIHCRFYLEDGTYPEVIKKSLPLLKDSQVLLCPSVNSRAADVGRRDPSAVRTVVKILGEMSDDAKTYGLGGVAPYMHAGNWLESLQDNIFIAQQVNRPNVGVMFHLHHWQQTCGTASYDKLKQDLRDAANALMIVVIQGSDEDAFTHRVVGEGTFDLKPLVDTLDEINYRGALGSMGYQQSGDIPAKLREGRLAWDRLKKPPSTEQIPLIVDTDVCDDIDDIWTLVLLLNCPEFDIRLITVSVNDTTAKAKVVARILERMGRTDIPIGIGPRKDTGYFQTWAYEAWIDDYDSTQYDGVVHENGAQAMVNAIHAAPDNIVLLSIGPLPTLSAALELDPAIAPKTQWVAMAGGIYRGYNAEEPSREYNVAAFNSAAQKVFSAAWRDALIAPLDVAVVSLRGGHYQRFHDSGSVASEIILENYLANSLHSIRRDKPKLSAEEVSNQAKQRVKTASSTLFDAVPLFMLLAPEAVRTETLPIRVSEKGYTLVDRAGGGKLIRCGTAWKQLPSFHEFLVARLSHD